MRDNVTDSNLYEPGGEASDHCPDIVATGSGNISSMFLSMAERHPDGADQDYLRWHTLDHRPEQQRLASIRASIRLVSTPACRAARACSHPDFDAVDHVMTYFFEDNDGLEEFTVLSTALRNAGRSPFILPPVQRGFYNVDCRVAANRVKIGADVLPWWPSRGVYLIIEASTAAPGDCAPTELIEVQGVAGIWSATAVDSPQHQREHQRVSYCFLDGDAVAVAAELKRQLEDRWQALPLQPLLAAPFYCLVPHEWDRYLP